MRELLAPHVDDYCKQLIEDVNTPTYPGADGPVSNPSHRGAMTLYAQIMRAIGSGDVIVNALVMQLGGSIDSAREAVAMVSNLPQDPHAIAEQCEAYLKFYRASFPKGRVEQ